MIVDRLSLISICKQLRADARRIAFTNGCFDILHAGHVSYLAQARSFADVLVVGLNTDNSVRRLKGKERPVIGESERAIVMNALRAVDYVTLFDEDTPLELITTIEPDVLVKGGDYVGQIVVGSDVVKQRGGEVHVVPFVPGNSTSEIIKRIRSL